MSLRDEAIKAMCLGCDRESCRRDGGAALDGLLDWLRGKGCEQIEAAARGSSAEDTLATLCDLLREVKR